MTMITRHNLRDVSHEVRGPTPNLLLRSLDPCAYAAIRPYLFPYLLRQGEDEPVGSDNEPLALFPECGMLALLLPSGDDACPIALVGREGMANHHLLFPQPRPSYQVSVQIEGTALAMDASDLRRLVGSVPQLRSAYLFFVAHIQLQMASTLRSSMKHTVEQRLARLLLMCRDRTDGDDIRFFHCEMAAVLGVRRASITDTLHRLEGRLAIGNTRGLISIRNRAILQEVAGDSYGTAEMPHPPGSEGLI